MRRICFSRLPKPLPSDEQRAQPAGDQTDIHSFLFKNTVYQKQIHSAGILNKSRFFSGIFCIRKPAGKKRQVFSYCQLFFRKPSRIEIIGEMYRKKVNGR